MCEQCGHRCQCVSIHRPARLYAADAVLFTEKTDEWSRVLADFNDAAHTMDLHTSWAKTTLQNIGSGQQPSAVDIHCNTVESTDCFSYLGSQLHSSGRSTTEIFWNNGIASSVMGHLSDVWRQSRLSVRTKLRLYNALVKSVLYYMVPKHGQCWNPTCRKSRPSTCPASVAFLGYAGMTSSRMPKLSIEHVKRASPH